MPPGSAIRILIVDDHPVVRRGWMAVLGRQPDMTVVGEAADLGTALHLCQNDPPDVILLALRLPGAHAEQAVAQIRAASPAGRILLLSTDEAGEDLCRALAAGAAGAVSRKAGPEEQIEAIRAIRCGAAWL